MTTTPDPVSTGTARILIVMVRYKTPLAESQTIEGLCKAFELDPTLAKFFEVLVWDNTAEPLHDPQLPIPFTYRHSGENLGISGACNHAMHYALEHGNVWLLLFDQDSTVTPDFLAAMLRHAQALEAKIEIAAIAPTMKVGAFTASPRRQLFNRSQPYPPGECGVAGGEAFAINSGCFMRATSLQAIGGFSLDFWLDYSDMFVFHQFFLHGFKVWRAADVELQHDMSIMDYDRLMSPWRYRNFSLAESAFNDLYKGHIENCVQTLRVFVRAMKQYRKYQNAEFSRIAWEQFLFRLKVTRRKRIAHWQQLKTLRTPKE